MVLLDQLPAVDGVARGDVSRAHHVHHGAEPRNIRLARGRAAVHLDRHAHRVLSRVRQHHYPERERCHQDRAGAAGRRARRVVYQPLRLCQRHVGADISAVVRLKQPLVYLRHHLQLPGL